MENVCVGLIILALFLVVQSFVILGLLRQAYTQRSKTIQQLLIAAVGKEEKSGDALRALIASDKSPRKNLPGIAGKKKAKDAKMENTDFTMKIGVNNGVEV